MTPVVPSQGGFVPHIAMLLDGLGLHAIDTAQERTPVETAFLEFLLAEFARLLPFDPAFYVAQYPDVAAAIERRELADPHEHFVARGFREGRLPHPAPFDPAYYRARYPDVAGVLHEHGRPGLRAHYDAQGRREGRAGHGPAQPASDRWYQARLRTPYRLAARTLEGAFVQAFQPPLVSGPPLGFRGGLVLGDGPADRRLRHRRGVNAVDSFPPNPDPVRALPGEYVYGGPYCAAFGHAMAEMIHRVLPARAAFDCRRLLFVGEAADLEPQGWPALPPAMRAPLSFLGVDPADVTVIHDNRAVERLHVAEQGSTLTGGPAAPYLQMLSETTPARLNALDDGASAWPRLYVSRSRLADGGTLLGERMLEALLAAAGWHVLHPQALGLVAQMQAYRHAEAIIFAEGSACHGTELFGAQALGHCVLLPRRHNALWWFENVLAPRARRFDVLPGATYAGTVLLDSLSGAPIDNLGVTVLDLAAIADQLRVLGLADLPPIDRAQYRAAATQDLDAYIARHRATGGAHLPGVRMIDAQGLAAFQARLRKLLA